MQHLHLLLQIGKRGLKMQQISNKTLTFLLLIAIVVSIAGTIISINRINQLISQAPVITAMAASPSGTGMVNVSVAALTSITATDTIIQFGSCSPNITYGANLSSNRKRSHSNDCIPISRADETPHSRGHSPDTRSREGVWCFQPRFSE